MTAASLIGLYLECDRVRRQVAHQKILYTVHRGDVTIGSIVRTCVCTYVPCHATYTHSHPFQPHAFTHVRAYVRTYQSLRTHCTYYANCSVLRCIVNCRLYTAHRGDVTIGGILRKYVCMCLAVTRRKTAPLAAFSPASVPAYHG